MKTEKITVTGLVQGIGFRPAVKRAAEKYGVSGNVRNAGGAVKITARAEAGMLADFKSAIKKIPQSIITGFFTENIADFDINGFEIIKSGEENTSVSVLTPDIAVCGRCMTEFYDRNNRRYMHPFISCTACGPRYSIIRRIPYDRANISMSEFEMCGECSREYTDIKNIRCHAQTIACNSCGPALSYTISGDPLVQAAGTIKNGGIAAVKDIGGYHFACDAKNESAAEKLRHIKMRDTKPFAVMFASIEEIMEYCRADEREISLLLSSARPIVLLKKKKDFAPSVCSASDYTGAFLPCNPVQYFLTKECGPLVMTSANLSGEPIITDDEKMMAFRDKTGAFEILSHNRRILTPLDDSVCRAVCGRSQIIRRARGYTPLPINIKAKNNVSVLAAGGDLKASFCFASEGRAYMSQYFGDLESEAAYDVWKNNISRMRTLLNINETVFVSDLHPLYRSALKKGETLQHHYAHMASVMAEHNLDGRALGFIFDGTGFGEDGNIWGGEAVLYDGGFARVASLEYTELLGGDTSAKDAALACDCFLISAGLEPLSENGEMIKAALANHINTAKSSGMGRLFDAVSAMLGISAYNSYEGESAILLERAAARAREAYPLELKFTGGVWRTAELIKEIYSAYKDGADINSLSLGFHSAIADAAARFAVMSGEKNIILSGGVFANRILTELCFGKLTKNGCNVYMNEQAPMNDGGIALGQAWYILNK